MALPQIEEGIIEPAQSSDDDEVIEDAEAAFMRMMNLGMSYGGMPMFNPYSYMMDPMMGMGGMGMGGMYNPMMGMGGMGMGGMYDPMMGMGGMGGMGGMYPPMMDPMMGMGMGGMGGMYPPMDMGMYNPMMGGMGGMGGMYDPMMGMGGMGMGGMYPPMDPMMGMGGMGMGGPLGYHHEEQETNAEELPFRNVDYPTDYTLPCSDHCACEQMCKFN